MGEKNRIFKRNKKVIRTSNQQQQKGRDKINHIIELIENLRTEAEELSVELKEIRLQQEDCKRRLNELRKKIYEMNQPQQLQKENNEDKQMLLMMNNTLETLTEIKEKNTNNILILPVNANNASILKEEMTDFMTMEFDIEVKVNQTFKLNNKIRLTKIANKNESINILQQATFLGEDLIQKEIKIQQATRRIAFEERIIVTEKVWTWNWKKDVMKEWQRDSLKTE